MMFGVPPAAATVPAPPPPAAPVNKNQTMMFGTPAAPKAPVTFGTASSNAAAAQAAAAPPPSSKATMVFGAAPVPAAPVNKNQTMMFGTPASNAATIVPPPPAPVGRTTIMFGGGSSAPPSPVVPPLAAPPPAKNQTMMFGTPASNAAPPPATAPTAIPRQTQVFGTAPPAALAPAKNQTMMFGTPASNALPEAPLEETVLEQPGQSARTMMFGTPLAPSEPAPAPVPPAPVNKNQTMMFGRPPVAIPKVTAGTVELAGIAADEEAPNESTVRVDVQQVIEEHEQESSPPEPAEAPRHDRTQRFAMSDVGGATPSEGREPVQDRHNRTQLFAMSNAQAPNPLVEAAEDPASSVVVGEATVLGDNMATLSGDLSPFEGSKRPTATFDLAATLPPDAPLLALTPRRDPEGVSVLHDPANLTPPEAAAAPVESPVATTLPNLPMAGNRPFSPLEVEYAPEPMGSPEDLRSPQAMESVDQDDAAALRAVRSGGAGRLVVIVLAIIALILLGVLVYRLFGSQLLGQSAAGTSSLIVESVARLS